MSASDWMKMRTNLWDDPRVGRIADEADAGEAAVIGALYWLWATADEHSVDGLLADMTFRQIDRKTGVKGFAEAVAGIGWIAETPEGVQSVRFDEHNGKSAKRRASESVRKMSARDADKVRAGSGRDAHLEEEVEKERDQKQKPKQERGSPSGSRLPPDWQPSADDLDFAARERPDVDARAEAAKFADFWRGAAGAKGRKADWPATWRNWIRRADAPKGNARAGPAPQPVGKQVQGIMALEEMKRERLARSGNPGGTAAAGLLVAGPHPGG